MIAFDIDGVIADLIPEMARHMKKLWDYDFNTTETSEHAINIPGVSDKEMWVMFDHIVTDHVDTILPHDGVEATMTRIYLQTQKPIYFLTARNPSVREATEYWLQKHIAVPIEVDFAGSSDKAQHLKELGYNIFVEDRLRTANDVAAVLDKVYLLNRNYNAERPIVHNVQRIDHLSEISLSHCSFDTCDSESVCKKLGACRYEHHKAHLPSNKRRQTL